MQILAEAPTTARYTSVTDQKAGGVTYTPSNLAHFVAAQILAAANLPTVPPPLRILDPAAGHGELLISLLEQIPQSRFDAIEVHGFETDLQALNVAKARIKQRFPKVSLHLSHGNFLDFVLNQVPQLHQETLFHSHPLPHYDLIIANPPYVRTQIMGAKQAQLLSSQFGLIGRVDLYYAFIVGMAHVLKPTGVGGIIVSNRFMTTKSGGAVRQAIRRHFNIRHVWDLGDTKLFNAAVLPAVLLVERNEAQQTTPAGFTSIYAATDEPTHHTTDVIEALDCQGVVGIDDGRSFIVKHGQLDVTTPSHAIWRVATTAGDDWLATVNENTWRRFGDIGKIRVGVKTCADKVFIRTDWDDVPHEPRPELLRPLTTHHAARCFRARTLKTTRHILYPHESINGQRRTVNLDTYPNTKAYLQQHRATLARRTYVIQAGRQWYEIWVPHDPARWAAPKLVFRDISEKPTFWLDLEGTIVNGDCYWLTTNRPENTELLWLAAAVANSTFIEAFYDHSFNNKLYAGRRRFITQYVERFPLPDPTTPLSSTIIALSKQIYELADTGQTNDLASQLDKLIWQVFHVPIKEVCA